MLGWLLCAVVAAGSQKVSGPWTPPPDPDPQAILGEAQDDTRAGRHDVALAKFLWFHRNALKHDPAFAGVRLSYAISYWMELADAYPPALDALKKTRDEAIANFRIAKDPRPAFEAFHDFVAINRHLGDEGQTVAVFEETDAARPELAGWVFRVARPALVRAKKYALYGKYVEPASDWLRAAELFHIDRRLERDRGREFAEFREMSFTNEVTTLLAVLVVNGRREEAEGIAKKARIEWDDPAFHAAIDSALTGVVPDPWP